MDHKKLKESCKSLNIYQSDKSMDSTNDDKGKKYLMFENKSNICWLDASLSIIAHTRTMRKCMKFSHDSGISKIISGYDEAISILNGSDKNINNRIKLTREKLYNVQTSILQYLQPLLKYKAGQPDSAFCCLYNLLHQDKLIREIFNITWVITRECTYCKDGYHRKKTKPILTITKINYFDPENLTSVFQCRCSNDKEQEMKLTFMNLPACIIFHFENGIAKGSEIPTSFTVQERQYQLTGVITLEKSQDATINHFVTWIRDPFLDKWLDCNDLNMDIVYFSPDTPDINLGDVYMCVFECFDELGTVRNASAANFKNSDTEIPCIDISDESEDISQNTCSQNKISESNGEKVEKPISNSLSVNFVSLESNKNMSTPEISINSKSTYPLDRRIQPTNFDQSLKTACQKTNKIDHLERQLGFINVNNEKVSKENVETASIEKLRESLNSTVRNNISVVNVEVTDKSSNKFVEDKYKNDELGDKTSLFDSSKAVSKSLFNGETIKENCFPSKTFLPKNYIHNKSEEFLNRGLLHQHEKPNQIKNAAMNLPVKVKYHESFPYKFCEASDQPVVSDFKNTISTSALSDVKDYSLPKKSWVSCNTLAGENVKKKNLDCVKTEDLYLTEISAKKGNSMQGQRNFEKPMLNSSIEQQIDSGTEHSASDATSSTDTLYVKFSRKRKKCSDLQLDKQDWMKEKSDLNQKICRACDASGCSKSVTEFEKSKPEDIDRLPVKKQHLSVKNLTKESCNVTAEPKPVRTGLKKCSPVKSKSKISKHKEIMDDDSDCSSGLNSSTKEKHPEEYHQLVPEHELNYSRDLGAAPAGEGLKLNTKPKSIEDMVIKDYEDKQLSHKRGCKCDIADLDESLDVVVDFVFSVFCKTGDSLRKQLQPS